jgi:hypothetical protein
MAMPTPSPALGSEAQVDDRVVVEVLKAYYPAALTAADSARRRAQAAYTIASAVAAAIVAAGVFGNVDEARTAVKVLGVCSLVTWLLAAAGYMWAVAGTVTGLESGDQPDGSSFVRAALNNVRAERKSVAFWSLLAQITTLVAIALTGIAIGIAVFNPPDPEKRVATLILSGRGQVSVERLCGRAGRKVTGTLRTKSLSEIFVAIDVSPRRCPRSAGKVQIRRSDVIGVVDPT